MGRRSITGGVIPTHSRIQFDFAIEGVRYRPTLPWEPTEANLRRAREHLRRIKTRIAAGTFNFAEEFPHFRGLHKLPLPLRAKTCSDVFDAYSLELKWLFSSPPRPSPTLPPTCSGSGWPSAGVRGGHRLQPIQRHRSSSPLSESISLNFHLQPAAKNPSTGRAHPPAKRLSSRETWGPSCKAYSYIGSRRAPGGRTDGRAIKSLRAMGTDRYPIPWTRHGRSPHLRKCASARDSDRGPGRGGPRPDLRRFPQRYSTLKVPSFAHACATRLLCLTMQIDGKFYRSLLHVPRRVSPRSKGGLL